MYFFIKSTVANINTAIDYIFNSKVLLWQHKIAKLCKTTNLLSGKGPLENFTSVNDASFVSEE